jgi:hypothetical protein
MPKLHLTDAAAKRLKTPTDAARAEYWDTKTPGFGLRISASGARSWVVITQVLVNGAWKQKRVTLGTYPAKSLAQARQDAQEAFTRAKQGKGPPTGSSRLRASRSSWVGLTVRPKAGQATAWWSAGPERPARRSGRRWRSCSLYDRDRCRSECPPPARPR